MAEEVVVPSRKDNAVVLLKRHDRPVNLPSKPFCLCPLMNVDINFGQSAVLTAETYSSYDYLHKTGPVNIHHRVNRDL